jgi:hypothetical protein
MMSRALEYKTVKEARENLPAVAVVDIAFTSNTDPANEFKPRQVFTIDEAWKFFHPADPKPW